MSAPVASVSAESLLGAAAADNVFRAPRSRGDHVESYFVRANHPCRPLALWVKATVLRPRAGIDVQESWFIFFDGESNRTFAGKQTEPFSAGFSQVRDGGVALEVCGASWFLAERGQCRGRLENHARAHASWDLRFDALAGPLGASMCLFPSRRFLEAPFPKNKTVSPMPMFSLSGSVEVFGESFALEGWSGLQGHNWGSAHAFEYAWGHCAFPESATSPPSWLEGFTGRIKIGPVTSPHLSSLVIQRGGEALRFDRLLDPWRQRATLSDSTWSLELMGDAGEARLTMDATGRPRVCLGYQNPRGSLAYCLNSKLAEVHVEVRPRRGAPFTLESPHGGALELLRQSPIPGLEVI